MKREITITVHYSDTNGGYMYSVYSTDADGVAEGADSFDGGLCTGTFKDAMDMAVDAAKKYATANEFDCPACDGKGYIVVNGEKSSHVERCDECKQYATDAEAEDAKDEAEGEN